uniref:ATP synthase-coupling factor 6, mitochondrial n=1 Tax=Timema monikensis TaxID=170555 RepID=A0A7R9HM87_9NEOP|nr:unnamed protein product [Timema monikensis]
MLVPQFLSATRRTLPIILRRNIGICAPALQKASDPIQQLFIDKVKEYRQKSSSLGGKLVDVNPEIEKELASELDKLAKQYGGGEGTDMTQFPNFKFTEQPLQESNHATLSLPYPGTPNDYRERIRQLDCSRPQPDTEKYYCIITFYHIIRQARRIRL